SNCAGRTYRFKHVD
ncbi:unnamed protein product, partial [Allacma fusca]